MKRSAPLRRTPMRRRMPESQPVQRRESRVVGLGTPREVVGVVMAAALASERAMAAPKALILRSRPYRLFVAQQECFLCGVVGYSQAAHENLGKAMQGKVCDSRTFPACGPRLRLPGCHYLFDNYIDIDRDDARALGAAMVERMQVRAVADGWDLATLRRRA